MRYPTLAKCELTVLANTGGHRYALNNIGGWVLSRYDGLGIPNVRRLSERSPFQDGDTDLGFRRDPRFIVFQWEQIGCSVADLWDLRKRIQGIFRPRTDDPTQLIFQLPNGDLRASDVNLTRELDHQSANRLDGVTHRVLVVLKASDPRLYDPTERVLTFILPENTEGWNVAIPNTLLHPVDHPWQDNVGWDVANTSGLVATTNRPNLNPTFGSGWNIRRSDFFLIQSILYAQGNLNADIEFPLIRLWGPIFSPTISNATTQEVLPFTAEGGLLIANGDYVDIDLRFGFKTIQDQAGNDVSQYLDPANDLATFHLSYNTELLPDGTRSTGQNTFTISGTGADANTTIEIRYFDRFVGA